MSKDTTAQRADLVRACALVKPALAAQPYVPALVHIAFDGKMATAFNDTTAISVACDVAVKRLVPGTLLVQALGSFGGKEVLFQQADDEHLVLSSGRAKVKLPTLDPKAWPFSWPSGDASEVDLSEDVLRGIEKCLISVDSNQDHPATMGVTLDEAQDGKAVLYSTDSRSISRYTTGAKVKLPGGAPVIMPTFFCEQLVSLRKAFPKEECWMELRANCLVARFGELATLFSKVPVDVAPMDFPGIYSRFTKDGDEAMVPIPDTLDAALGRALLVVGGEVTKKTEVECTKRGIKLFSKSPVGEAEDTCEGETKGLHDEPVTVNAQYLARAAKVTTQMGVTSKVTMFGDAEGKFLHLIAHVA